MADVSITRLSPARHYVLHCASGDAAAVGSAYGVTLPEEMLCWSAGGDWRALHLAPDEWQLIGTGAAPLSHATDVPAHSLVDVGSRMLGLAIEGSAAATLINAGCPLDLSAAAFPAGRCTRTLLGKVQIILERDHNCFRMQYGRSFQQYVTAFLEQAAMDAPVFGPT